MLYYTVVNKKNCEACGLCISIAPDIYQVDGRGKSFGVLDNNQGIMGIQKLSCKQCWRQVTAVQQVRFK